MTGKMKVSLRIATLAIASLVSTLGVGVQVLHAQVYVLDHAELDAIEPVTVDNIPLVKVTYKNNNGNRKASITGWTVREFNKTMMQPAEPLLAWSNQDVPTNNGNGTSSVWLKPEYAVGANAGAPDLIAIRMHFDHGGYKYWIEKRTLVPPQTYKKKDGDKFQSQVVPSVKAQAPNHVAVGGTLEAELGANEVWNEHAITITMDCGDGPSAPIAYTQTFGTNKFTYAPEGTAGKKCMICIHVRRISTGEVTRKCFYVTWQRS